MIDRSTNIQSALRSRQRGFLLNPFRFGSGTPPTPLLLDDYPGAAFAYSLRKIRAAYTGPAIRVVATRGSATKQDIGFDSFGNVDEAALLSFAGAGSAFIETWYDQTGNGRHAVKGSGAEPTIVVAGSINLLNGKPAALFEKGSTRTSLAITSPPATTQVYSCFASTYVTTTSGVTGVCTLLGGPTGGPQFRFDGQGGTSAKALIVKSFTAAVATSSTFAAAKAMQSTFATTAGASSIRVNGSSVATGGGSSFTVALRDVGVAEIIDENFAGGMHEIICYTSDQSSNAAAIEADQIGAYSIVI